MRLFDNNPDLRDPDEALRELIERQHLIEQMEETPGWSFWADFLTVMVQKYQSRLLRGTHKDLLDYRYDAGVVEGIRIALGVSDSLQTMVNAQREILAMNALANEGEPE